jgi:hypothetical protein
MLPSATKTSSANHYLLGISRLDIPPEHSKMMFTLSIPVATARTSTESRAPQSANMASSESTKKDNGKRPSRLLNLNKSPRAQGLLGATNAANSPLLLLPPELRGRIWNHVFGQCVFSVNISARVTHKRLHLERCQVPRECPSMPPLETLRGRRGLEISLQLLGSCSQFTSCPRPFRGDIPLHMLHSCWRIVSGMS